MDLASFQKAIKKLRWISIPDLEDAKCSNHFKAAKTDIIHEVSLGSCVEGGNGSWLKYAEEVLKNNKLHPAVFGTAVRELLTLGCGKYRNMIIVGPSNCGKTFLLKPLESIL